MLNLLNKVYAALVLLLIILPILLLEPIIKGIIKERLDFKEIADWYSVQIALWKIEWRNNVCL